MSAITTRDFNTILDRTDRKISEDLTSTFSINLM